MSHYLKILLDCIFGEKNFRNEIIWCYHGPGSPHMRQFNRKTDNIYWYNKGDSWIFNKEEIRTSYKGGQPNDGGFKGGNVPITDTKYKDGQGKIPENWWPMRIAARSSKEYVGYPTQKPLMLLDRIIRASSREGDVVLDPFCGCATTCVAAEMANRQWVGIDVSVKAYELVKQRLASEFGNDRVTGTKMDVQYSNTPPRRTDQGEGYLQKKMYTSSHTPTTKASTK